MTATVSEIRPRSPRSAPKPAPRPRPRRKPAGAPRAVVATAAALPAAAAALGWIACDVAAIGHWLAVLPAALTAAILRVSLPHVARGLARTLRVSSGEAWSLAVAVDLAMITAEVVVHFAPVEPATAVVAWAVVAAGLAGSTFYNVAGFRS